MIAACESCSFTTCPGCTPIPVYPSDDRCAECGGDVTYGDGFAECLECGTREAMCTCGVVGDEDVTCALCRETAREAA